MKRSVSLLCEGLLDEAELVIELDESAVAILSLELTLLLSGLVEALRIRLSRGPSLILTLIDSDRLAKAVVVRQAEETLSFALGRNQAEYLQAVLLRAYRDQMAAVNHVHIEGCADASPFDLTVMFKVFREPMSAEDARRLLDDDSPSERSSLSKRPKRSRRGN